MRTHLFRMTNFRGIQNLELKPNAVTAIRGGNGMGKTSVIAAFRSLAIGGSEPDAVMVGEEEATIHWVLELMEGDCGGAYPPGRYTVTRTIRLDGYSLTVKNPKGVKIPKEKAFVEACLPKLAYDPIAFDKLSDEARAEALKSILMVSIKAVDIRKAAGLVNLGAIAEEEFADGVAAIEKFDGTLETQAKELRAGIKMLDGTIKNFEQTLEGKSVDDVAADLERAKMAHGSAVSAVDNALKRLVQERDESIKNASIAARETTKADNDWYNGELAKLNEALKLRQKTCIETLSAVESAAHTRFTADSESELTPLRNEVATATANITTLEARAAEAQKLIGAREELERWKTDKTTKAEDLERITVARDQLDKLKNKTLAKMTLPGMTIKKGRLFVGEVLSSLVNTAARIMKWFEIASMYANDGQLILCDDMQSLEAENLKVVEDAIRANGLQLIATFVDFEGGPLRVVESLVEK